ncbi:nuclease [Modicella reniformis]|uniref:Nuclease n=1 Tax=Modicella reniformis TaxID=1440133 RepID=A0A9P6MBI0_9FUNG|nr:nuclease [Modicella reniformis]
MARNEVANHTTFTRSFSTASIPNWVAQHLTVESLKPGEGVGRGNSTFREDPTVPDLFKARLADYFKSGYDCGHMAPAADCKRHYTFPTLRPKSGQGDMAAFVLPNNTIQNDIPLTAFQVPIEAVEKATGLKFFETLERKALKGHRMQGHDKNQKGLPAQ